MNGGEAIVKALELANISHIFGLLGSTTLELYDALYEHKSITYIGVRDERAGTHMADAIGRVSGRPGVFLFISAASPPTMHETKQLAPALNRGVVPCSTLSLLTICSVLF